MTAPSLTVGTDGWVSVALDEHHECRVRFRRGDDGHLAITDVHLHGSAITPKHLRDISLSRIEAAMLATPQSWLTEDFDPRQIPVASEDLLAALRAMEASKAPERPRLTRANGAAPEEFYPRVAAAYLEYAPRTRAPAKAIATEAKVPVTTAHRWVREARRLGFLPPGRKGKVG